MFWSHITNDACACYLLNNLDEDIVGVGGYVATTSVYRHVALFYLLRVWNGGSRI